MIDGYNEAYDSKNNITFNDALEYAAIGFSCKVLNNIGKGSEEGTELHGANLKKFCEKRDTLKNLYDRQNKLSCDNNNLGSNFG